MGDAATWTAIGAALIALVGAGVAWRKMPAEIRTQKVDTDLAVSTEARQLLAELRSERDDMRRELAAIRAELQTTRRELTTTEHRIFKLEQWVRAQGADPTTIYGT